MANPRTKARIEARIRERVAYCLEFEVNDPRASFLTVTGASITDDLQLATVRYSVLGGEGDRNKVARMLEDATGFVRSRLGRVLRLRRIPKLRWEYDDSAELQDRMERSIRAALEHDREVNPDAHPDLAPKSESEPGSEPESPDA